jgi:hypothetical protein
LQALSPEFNPQSQQKKKEKRKKKKKSRSNNCHRDNKVVMFEGEQE